MKTQHRKQETEKKKREKAFRIPYGKHWNEFHRKWVPDPEHRAAEKRKREEAMLNFIAGQKRLPADIESLLDEVPPSAQPRIWIGTGDAGEPNEQ